MDTLARELQIDAVVGVSAWEDDASVTRGGEMRDSGGWN